MKRIIVTVTFAIAVGGAWGQAAAAGEADVAKARSFIKGLDRNGNGTLHRRHSRRRRATALQASSIGTRWLTPHTSS